MWFLGLKPNDLACFKDLIKWFLRILRDCFYTFYKDLKNLPFGGYCIFFFF